jgi:hypothetical protein
MLEAVCVTDADGVPPISFHAIVRLHNDTMPRRVFDRVRSRRILKVALALVYESLILLIGTVEFIGLKLAWEVPVWFVFRVRHLGKANTINASLQ